MLTPATVLDATHKGIQLWKNGPYWAETNIGAERPEDYGFYFWWGDTVGYMRDGDSWVSSDGSKFGFLFIKDKTPTCGKSFGKLKDEGWITAEGNLALGHDAAHVQWGGEWRMPTFDELKVLIWSSDYSLRDNINTACGLNFEAVLRHAIGIITDANRYEKFRHKASDYEFREVGRSIRPVRGFDARARRSRRRREMRLSCRSRRVRRASTRSG